MKQFNPGQQGNAKMMNMVVAVKPAYVVRFTDDLTTELRADFADLCDSNDYTSDCLDARHRWDWDSDGSYYFAIADALIADGYKKPDEIYIDIWYDESRDRFFWQV